MKYQIIFFFLVQSLLVFSQPEASEQIDTSLLSQSNFFEIEKAVKLWCKNDKQSPHKQLLDTLYKYKAQKVMIYSTRYDNFEGSPSKRVIFFTCYFYEEGDEYEPFYLAPRFFFLVNDTPYFQRLSVTAAGVGEVGLNRLKKEKEQTLGMNLRISDRLVEFISFYDKSGELVHDIAIEPYYYYQYQDKFKHHMTLLLSIKEEILRTLILGW